MLQEYVSSAFSVHSLIDMVFCFASYESKHHLASSIEWQCKSTTHRQRIRCTSRCVSLNLHLAHAASRRGECQGFGSALFFRSPWRRLWLQRERLCAYVPLSLHCTPHCLNPVSSFALISGIVRIVSESLARPRSLSCHLFDPSAIRKSALCGKRTCCCHRLDWLIAWSDSRLNCTTFA